MLEHYEQQLEQWINEIVVTGDDDALFASGYLQGHFAVVLSELEVEADHSVAALDDKMQNCLKLAAKELEDHDYRLVADAWQSLRTKLA